MLLHNYYKRILAIFVFSTSILAILLLNRLLFLANVNAHSNENFGEEPEDSYLYRDEPTSKQLCLIDEICVWLLGVNYPWLNYGHDFGEAAWQGSFWPHDGVSSLDSKLKIEQDFAYLQSKGVPVIRWFLFADGRASPEFDDQGYVTGFDDFFYTDLDMALSLAHKYDLHVILVLLDYQWLYTPEVVDGVRLGGHTDIITDPAKRQSFFENALKPLLTKYANDQRIIAWEVMNEPEWVTEGITGGGTQGMPVSLAEMQSFISEVVEYVHTYASQQVTLGSAKGEWLTFWRDVNLDFYQFHYYDQMGGQEAPFIPYSDLDLDKPAILGEFPTKSSDITMTGYLSTTWINNFAGAIAWSLNANDEFSNFTSSTSTDQFLNWSQAHTAEVDIPWVYKLYLPITLKNYLPPFSPPLNISNTSAQSTNPAMAVSGNGDVEVVWLEGDPDNAEIYHRQKPYGQAWMTSTTISLVADKFLAPDIAVDPEGTVHIVWVANVSPKPEIYHAFKTLMNDWSIQIIETTASEPPNITLARDCQSGVHLVWTYPIADHEPSNRWWMYHARLYSDGTMPQKPTVIGLSEAIDPVDPVIAVDTNCTLHLVYNDWANNTTKWDIFYRQKPSGGSWTPLQNIGTLPEDAHAPAIAVGPNQTVHVVWANLIFDKGWSQNLYYVQKPTGQVWSPPEALPGLSLPPPAIPAAPMIVVGSSGITEIIWQGLEYICGGDVIGEEYLIIGHMYRLDNAGWNRTPNLACEGSVARIIGGPIEHGIHAVWTAGNNDIYYSER